MADNRTGKITQVIGAVLDIKFSSDNRSEEHTSELQSH